MKAKEYAAQLLNATTKEEYETQLFTFLDELVFSTIATMKQRANEASSLACIRETFTKWKSIVAQVQTNNPYLTIDNALFVKYFSAASPPLFTMAMEKNAFLGYTPDKEDLQVVQQGKNEISAIEMRERLVKMQQAATKMGIDPNMLLAQAVLSGNIKPHELLVASLFS